MDPIPGCPAGQTWAFLKALLVVLLCSQGWEPLTWKSWRVKPASLTARFSTPWHVHVFLIWSSESGLPYAGFCGGWTNPCARMSWTAVGLSSWLSSGPTEGLWAEVALCTFSSAQSLTFNSHLCSCLKLLIKTQSASWIPHSLPKDGEASVAMEMARLELFGRGRGTGRMASLGLPFPSHFGPGCLDVSGEGSGLRRKS